MTDDRSLERAARSWIEVGPTAAPPHVVDAALALIDRTPQEREWLPWRFPTMSNSARVMALIAIGALILAGAFALVGAGGRVGPLPSTNPSPLTSPAAASAQSALTETFTSQAYGYSVKVPAGWTIKPATKLWSTGAVNLWGSGFNDELTLQSAGIRFSGASQTLASGQSADDWLTSYAAGADRGNWRRITVDGETGYVTADGVAAAGGTISPGGLMYDGVVVTGERAYNFNMDGKVDRATFDAFVATITLDPSSAGALPPLEKQFTSSWYGYTIARSADWTVTPATTHWHGVDNSTPAVDEIVITGTDTTVPAASQLLPQGTTYDTWLASFHQNTVKNVPLGCDGGDPSTWPALKIGDKQGKLEMLCNGAEALILVGGRVYVFDWSNSTFDTSQHFGIASWTRLLETVTFDPASAVDR